MKQVAQELGKGDRGEPSRALDKQPINLKAFERPHAFKADSSDFDKRTRQPIAETAESGPIKQIRVYT